MTAAAFPSTTAAQSPYNFPGAVERLESGNPDNFPDPRESRLWLWSFTLKFSYECNVQSLPLPSRVSPIEFGFAANMYASGISASGIRNNDYIDFSNSVVWELMKSITTSGSPDQISLWGIYDGAVAAEANNCDNATQVMRSATTIIYNYAGKAVNPLGKPRFLSMASPEVLEALNVDESEVARFKPGYRTKFQIIKEELTARAASHIPPSDQDIHFEEHLAGPWNGNVISGPDSSSSLRVYFEKRKFHTGPTLTSVVSRMDCCENTFVPSVIYRGSSRIEASTNYGSSTFPKYLAGTLSEDGTRIRGWFYHYELDTEAVQVLLTKEENAYVTFKRAYKQLDHERAYAMIEEAIRRQEAGESLSENEQWIFDAREYAPDHFGTKARKRGDVEEALYHFRRAIEWGGGANNSIRQGYNYVNLGEVLAKTDRREEALEALQKGLSIIEERAQRYDIQRIKDLIRELKGE